MPTAWYEVSATSSNNFFASAGMANVICASNIVEIYDGKHMSFLPINCSNPWFTCLNNYYLFCQGKSVLCTSIQNSAGSHHTPRCTTYITTFAGTLLGLLGSWCKYLHVLSTGLTGGFIVKRFNANYVLYMHCIPLILWADSDCWTKPWKHPSMQWHPCKQVNASGYVRLTYFCCFI